MARHHVRGLALASCALAAVVAFVLTQVPVNCLNFLQLTAARRDEQTTRDLHGRPAWAAASSPSSTGEATNSGFSPVVAATAAAAVVATAGGLVAKAQPRGQRGVSQVIPARATVLTGSPTPTSRSQTRTARAGWPFEDDDPYAKCSALKVQVGLQFSKSLLDTLNKLADTADTSTSEGLHQLLLDVVLALRRSEASWRYGTAERKLFDSEDEGREANSLLQRWGVDAQSKWGDGENWEKMDRNPSGTTEYLIVTFLVSCYGTLCPKDEQLKVRSGSDLKKVLEAVSGIQEDELMLLDVLWIPEEEGDSLSAMEVTMKFPELAIL